MRSSGEEPIDLIFNKEKGLLYIFRSEDEKEGSDSRKKFQEIDKIKVEPEKNAIQEVQKQTFPSLEACVEEPVNPIHRQ